MKRFPERLVPANRGHFADYRFRRECCKFRARVIDYMYAETRDGLDITDTPSEIVNHIITELQTLGWKTLKAYGDSTLYIYEQESELPLLVLQNRDNVVLDC